MNKSDKNAITKRVLEVLEVLKIQGIVNGSTDFAIKCKFNQSSFSEIYNGKRSAPLSLVNSVCETFNINRLFIFEGKEPMFLNVDKIRENTYNSNAKSVDIASDKLNLTIVPLKAFGGLLNGYANKIYMETLEKVPFPFIRGECFAFEVDGFSMYLSKIIDGEIYERGYKPQSYVVCTLVESPSHLIKGRDYVLQTTEGIILKTFVKVDEKFCYLKAINDDYNPVKPIPLKSIKVIYFVERKL